jgi:hypothetical protein
MRLYMEKFLTNSAAAASNFTGLPFRAPTYRSLDAIPKGHAFLTRADPSQDVRSVVPLRFFQTQKGRMRFIFFFLTRCRGMFASSATSGKKFVMCVANRYAMAEKINCSSRLQECGATKQVVPRFFFIAHMLPSLHFSLSLSPSLSLST